MSTTRKVARKPRWVGTFTCLKLSAEAREEVKKFFPQAKIGHLDFYSLLKMMEQAGWVRWGASSTGYYVDAPGYQSLILPGAISIRYDYTLHKYAGGTYRLTREVWFVVREHSILGRGAAAEAWEFLCNAFGVKESEEIPLPPTLVPISPPLSERSVVPFDNEPKLHTKAETRKRIRALRRAVQAV